MTEKIIPLIYILALGFVAFRVCNAAFPDSEKLDTRHIAFFIILNVTGFLVTALLPAPYAVFLITSALCILILVPVEPVPRIAMFLFLCPILPDLNYDIRIGIPLLNMSWSRWLTIAILLPMLAGAIRRKPLFQYPADKYVLAFFVLNAVLAFRDTSFTNGLRGTTYVTVDMLVPYFVLSRYLDNFADIRKVLFALLAALAFTGMVNVFETIRTWYVYEEMMLNVNGARYIVTERLGLLRATGPFGVPSRSAFALTIGLGLCWALLSRMQRRAMITTIVAALSAGLFLTFSRGNWIGATIVGSAYLFTANRKQFFRLGAALAVVWITLSALDFTDEIVSVLPFIGAEQSEAAETVNYRQALLDTSIRVANETPWFGSSTYHEHPDMNALRQASGLLDMVNHYLIILLSTGYVGLVIFICIFLSTLMSLRRALAKSVDKAIEESTLCRALMFTLTGLLVAITTTSALGRTGLFLWCMVAIAAVAAECLAPARAGNRTVTAASGAYADR